MWRAVAALCYGLVWSVWQGGLLGDERPNPAQGWACSCLRTAAGFIPAVATDCLCGLWDLGVQGGMQGLPFHRLGS